MIKEILKKYLWINELNKYIENVSKNWIADNSELRERIDKLENDEKLIKEWEYLKVWDNRLVCISVKFNKNIPEWYEEVIRIWNKFLWKVPVFEVPNIICGWDWKEITNKKEKEMFDSLLK